MELTATLSDEQQPHYDSNARRLYDHILSHGVDFDIVYPYDQLEAVAEKPRNTLYGLMQKVNGWLGDSHQRHLQASPDLGGYRVIRPEEHDNKALHHLKKSRRQVGKAIKVAEDTDVGHLTAAQRDAHDIRRSGLNAIARTLAYQSKQIGRLKLVAAAHEARFSDNDDRLAALEKKVETLTQKGLPSG